jgi:GTPase SAR1 family protein
VNRGTIACNTRVGKTHIINEYLLRKMPENPASTIAVEFATTVYTLRDGTSVKVEVWDTAGHEKYK